MTQESSGPPPPTRVVRDRRWWFWWWVGVLFFGGGIGSLGFAAWMQRAQLDWTAGGGMLVIAAWAAQRLAYLIRRARQPK